MYSLFSVVSYSVFALGSLSVLTVVLQSVIRESRTSKCKLKESKVNLKVQVSSAIDGSKQDWTVFGD